MKLEAKTVHDTFLKCLFEEGEDTTSHIKAEGVMINIGFNPKKIEENKETIKQLLDELPENFRKEVGGGYSFLAAAEDKHGNQWGEHSNIDELLTLGLASGNVEYLMPRALWGTLPGGMPYFVIKN